MVSRNHPAVHHFASLARLYAVWWRVTEPTKGPPQYVDAVVQAAYIATRKVIGK